MPDTGKINIYTNIANNRGMDYSNAPIHHIIPQFPNDAVEISTLNKNSARKVNFPEGCKLVIDGFFNKSKDILLSIVKKPVTTLLTIGITTAGLMALPLIGIPMATGAAIMVIGFGSLAIVKTGIDAAKAAKNSSEGDYDELRKNLRQIGGDGLDLALSLPFMPKGINIIKSQINYLKNGGKITLNNELISQISKAKGLRAKFNALKQGQLALAEDLDYQAVVDKLNVPKSSQTKYFELRKLEGEQFAKEAYKQLVKDTGYEGMAPELNIRENLTEGVGYSPVLGTIEMNPKILTSSTKSTLLGALRHEFRHFEQAGAMMRSENIGIIRCFRERVKAGSDVSDSEILEFIDPKAFDLYERVIKAKGCIKSGTREAKMAERYLKSYRDYVTPTEVKRDGSAEKKRQYEKHFRSYMNNLLEREAYGYSDKAKLFNSDPDISPVANSIRAISAIEAKEQDS